MRTRRKADWFYGAYWINDLPLRHRIDPLIRIANIVKATIFPRKTYSIETFRVAVTNICNARCCFCAYPQAKMVGNVMSLETFKRAIPYFAGQSTVDPTPAIGDPLIDLGLEAKVNALSLAGIKAQFTTNAILIRSHADWIVKLAASIECLHVSIPGFEPQDWITQFGVYKGDAALDGLSRLLFANAYAGQPLRVRIQIRNREHPRTVKRSKGYQHFKQFIHGSVSVHFTGIWDNWSGAVDTSTWSDYMRDRLRWCPQIASPCRNLRSALINPDGTIRLCGCRVIGTDHDDLLIGAVGDSVEQLTANAVKVRARFLTKDYPTACKSCSFYNPE